MTTKSIKNITNDNDILAAFDEVKNYIMMRLSGPGDRDLLFVLVS